MSTGVSLRSFLLQQKLAADTKFWVRDFSIRQASAKADLVYLGPCIARRGRTVLVLDLQQSPCQHCIMELWHTQIVDNAFFMTMGEGQRREFRDALQDKGNHKFDSVVKAFSTVDVSQADCRDEEIRKLYLLEIKQKGGIAECNRIVSEALSTALITEGRATLEAMSTENRGTSTLINNLGVFLQEKDELDAAKELLDEALETRRRILGNTHPHTVQSIYNMGQLLQDMGEFQEAKILYEEHLQASRKVFGDTHSLTLM